MKLYITLALSLILLACVAWPQTGEEFMSTMGEGEKSVVNKSFKSVTEKNNKLFKKCFDVYAEVRNTSINYGEGSGENITFTPKINKNKKSVVYSLQQSGTAHINTGYPEDGMFIFSAKVEMLSKDKTKITTNAMWHHGNLETAFHEWSKGVSIECPDLL